jgi:Electron transfer DM13
MNNRLRLTVIGAGALLVVIVLTFPLWRPLFVNTVVNEAFPGLSADQEAAFVQLSPTQQRAFQSLVPTDATMAVEMAKAALSPDNVVPTEQQAMPTMTDPTVAATGTFIQIDAIHGASGTATLYQLPDNSRVLRFEDFKATNGPDLHVILTKNADPRTPDDVGEDYVELGQLKGNIGSQNYNVPAEIDLIVYKGVVIYCEPFHVVFSTASLRLS